MVLYLLLAFLFIGGIMGWSLFAYTLVQLVANREHEIVMIDEIKEELKIVKQEVQELK